MTSSPSGAGLLADVTVHGGISVGTVRVSLLPGALSTAPEKRVVLAFVDRGFPSFDGPNSDVLATSDWVGNYLSALRFAPSPGVGLVDAGDLPRELALHPTATLLCLVSGIVPTAVYSANSSLLRDWVEGGGTLVWASGPLMYYSAWEGPSGSIVYSDLGWGGQGRFLGFNLTDPPPAVSGSAGGGATMATVPTPIGSALGLSYGAAPYGANVTRLYQHGGYSIGRETAVGSSGSASPRTSIAVLPMGQGRLIYFGGGTSAPNFGTIASASEDLAQDIALLVALGYVPASGAPATQVVSLGIVGSATAHLGIANRSAGVVVAARSSVPGSVLFVWGTTLSPPTSTAGTIVPSLSGEARGGPLSIGWGGARVRDFVERPSPGC